MTVDELPEYLKAKWLSIKAPLLKGEYQPRPVKGVEIPKPGNRGKRRLGIPCVIDRFIEQAMLQVLQRQWDRAFSESSYGYRPGRSALNPGCWLAPREGQTRGGTDFRTSWLRMRTPPARKRLSWATFRLYILTC